MGIAAWLIIGAITALWMMIALTFDIGGLTDSLRKQMELMWTKEHRLLLLALVLLAVFLLGPVGLAVVLRKEFVYRKKRNK